MTTGPYSQVIIRLSDLQIIKEGLRHFIIIMLPGVHQIPLNFVSVGGLQSSS